MVTDHYLKTWPHSHGDIGTLEKNFDVRKNHDRDFAVGDILFLQLFHPVKHAYLSVTGAEVEPEDAHTHVRVVRHILHGGRFGLPEGVTVMGIGPVDHIAKAQIENELRDADWTEAIAEAYGTGSKLSAPLNPEAFAEAFEAAMEAKLRCVERE